jgi:hypothetical protein
VLPNKAVWHGDFAACHALHDFAENFTSWAVEFLRQFALKLFLQLLSIKHNNIKKIYLLSLVAFILYFRNVYFLYCHILTVVVILTQESQSAENFIIGGKLLTKKTTWGISANIISLCGRGNGLQPML